MRLTVLIAVHDGGDYLREAVASVLAQTYGDFELLLVDDASTDAAVDALPRDPRIRVVRNERNLGQVTSLNRGLAEARGEYVARLDADDVMFPTRLERQVAVLDADPTIGLVGSWVDIIGANGRRLGSQRGRLDDLGSYVFATLTMRVYVAHPAATYRRDPVLALGGYDESMGPSEDHDLWRRLLLAGWDARIVPEPLVSYRVHERQLSHTRSAVQQERDATSQMRFLAELAPGIDVRPVQLLLAGDPAFWHADADAARAALDPLLAAAASRFGVDAPRLRALVAARVVEMAARRPWHPGAGALLAWGGRRAALRALATSPLREGLRLAGKAAPFRSYARRSWILRRIFGRLAGTS